MEPFKFHKTEISFWKVSGEVIGNSKYNETHISSSGGGGFVDKNGGYVGAPTVSSEIVTNHEFWIKTKDGTEKNIKIKGLDIPLRVGQKITVISAGEKDADKGWYSILVNHNAKKHWFINDAKSLNKNIGIISGKFGCFPLTMAAVVFIAIRASRWSIELFGYHFSHKNISGLVLAAILLFAFIMRGLNRTYYESELDKHLEELAQKAYQESL